MCVGDIQRYFHSYPTALDDRDYYCIEYGGSCWCYSKCCFGHTACPYYTSTFGAEYHHWFNEMGIPNSMIVDDWFTAAPLLEQAMAQMSKMSGIFESIGFTMQRDKYKYGQQVLFLGLLIDSTTMTVRIEAVVAKSFRIELEIYLRILIGGKHLDHHLIRPICGKLNWFAEILQSGRLHIHSFWNYLKHYKASYPASMNQLRSDIQWWAINKGNCKNSASRVILIRILHYCDLYQLQILAFWVPREQNTFADYLSHLSTYMDRTNVTGQFRRKQRPSQAGTSAVNEL